MVKELMMEKLPDTINRNGLSYKQVKRNDKAAMYEQFMGDKSLGFEVFHVKVQKEVVWPNGNITPEKEAFPSNEHFGLWAWAYDYSSSAEKKYDQITNEVIETTTRMIDGEAVLVKKKKFKAPAVKKEKSVKGRGRPRSTSIKVNKPREKFVWEGIEYNSKSDVVRKLLKDGFPKHTIASKLKITVQTVHANLVKMKKDNLI